MFERIRQALKVPQQIMPISSDELGITQNLNPAAVLVPVLLKDGKPHLLMTQRTEMVYNHKNQISFPGGGVEPGDSDLVATALRESDEEIGLKPSDVEVLGRMEDMFTMTGYRISPVVGRIPFPYPFIPNPSEVREVLIVPWEIFFEGEHHREEQIELSGRRFTVDYYQYEQHTIWGATARIAKHLVKVTGAINP